MFKAAYLELRREAANGTQTRAGRLIANGRAVESAHQKRIAAAIAAARR